MRKTRTDERQFGAGFIAERLGAGKAVNRRRGRGMDGRMDKDFQSVDSVSSLVNCKISQWNSHVTRKDTRRISREQRHTGTQEDGTGQTLGHWDGGKDTNRRIANENV